jgi:hypothetical protein
MRISFAPFPDSSASKTLMQGTVAISSNVDCKTDTNFGKYVTDSNIWISATDKFVCTVIHQFYSLPTIELAFLRAKSQLCLNCRVISVVQYWSFRRQVIGLKLESTATPQVMISMSQFDFCYDIKSNSFVFWQLVAPRIASKPECRRSRRGLIPTAPTKLRSTNF